MSRQASFWPLACWLVGIAATCCSCSSTTALDLLQHVQEGQQHGSLRMLLADTPPTTCPAAMKRMFDTATKDTALLLRINQDCRAFVDDVSTCGASCMCTFVKEVLNITRLAYRAGLFPGDETSDFYTGAACGAYAREVFMKAGYLPQHVLEIWNGSECLPVIAAGKKCSFDEEDDSETSSSGTSDASVRPTTPTAAVGATGRTQAGPSSDVDENAQEPAGTLGRKIKL